MNQIFLRPFPVRLFLTLSILTVGSLLPSRAAYADEVYLPLVIGLSGECNMSVQSSQVADLMRNSPIQQRQGMGCNEQLAAAAQARAEDMARNDYFGHTSPSGMTPNRLVEEMGYNLPDYYSKDGNNIESIAAGTSSPEATWGVLMDSPHHKTHLTGENGFYRNQVDFGVGYAHNENSRYKHYWVIITAESGG